MLSPEPDPEIVILRRGERSCFSAGDVIVRRELGDQRLDGWTEQRQQRDGSDAGFGFGRADAGRIAFMFDRF